MRRRVVSLTVAVVLTIFATAAGPTEKGPRRIDVSVTEGGFVPKRLTVKKGEPVTLIFTRRTDRTCAKDVVIYLDDDRTIMRKLPLNQPVEVTVTFQKAGERGFACSMKMHGAAIMVE
jgi:plastocyanin domain-containing protein